MWAMIPMLRTWLSSNEGMAISKKSPQRHKDTKKKTKEEKKEWCLSQGLPGRAPYPAILLCSFLVSVVTLRCISALLSPREVGEGLVGFGHFDGVFAFGHGVAFAAVSVHQP